MEAKLNKKTTILAVAGIVLLGGVILGGIGGYGYFQECLWDKEYLHVLQDLKEAEQAKEYERLLQTAKADKKPYLRNIISGYYFAVKDYPKAKAHLTQAEAEFSEIGDVGGQIRTLYSLGSASLATDNPDEAEKYMSKALKLFGDKDEIDSSTMPLFGFRIPGTLPSTPKARIISSLARLKARTGHPAEAEALYKQAILDKETYERVSSYTDYADFLTNQKRQKEAAAMLKTAEESIEAQKHGKGEYDSSELALSSLASHYEFASEFSQALRIYKKCAERTAQSKGASSDEHIRTLVQIAQCYEKMGQEEDEHKVLEDAYKLSLIHI